jgi:hypothetical protein
MDEFELSEVVGLGAGAGMLLVQAAAVIPGLFPCLVLLLPLVLPLLLVGVVGSTLRPRAPALPAAQTSCRPCRTERSFAAPSGGMVAAPPKSGTPR